jgi:hypothetical protein
MELVASRVVLSSIELVSLSHCIRVTTGVIVVLFALSFSLLMLCNWLLHR